MSNRLFQGFIQQMKEGMDRVIGVIDETGVVVACSELTYIGEVHRNEWEMLVSTGAPVVLNGITYRMIPSNTRGEYAVFCVGEDEEANKNALILSISLSNIKSVFDEKYDKASFIRNIILDNILPSDIFVKSKELHFATDEVRVIFLIRFATKTEMLPYEIIQSLFPDKAKDYVIHIGEREVALVKEVKPNSDAKDLEKIAQGITDTLSGEFYAKAYVGISTVVSNIKDLARAYKEAQMALDVGKIFDAEKSIISYDNLGIGRLIYQLPTTLCEMFLDEVFKKGDLESLDKETLQTIQAFFENNLNVSETSRKLFVHRNTLVYRLEKIRKITGLDLREFDHAITFKVALMVQKYLNSKNTTY